MQNRDRSPERGSPRGGWNIEWEDEWHEGHQYRRRSINDYRFSRNGRVVEMRVSNYDKHQTTFILDADDLEKVKEITWRLVFNPRHTYWRITHDQHERRNPKLIGFPRHVVLARYLRNYTGPLEIDHKNRDTLDQRQFNLRITTRKNQNNNKSRRRDSTTGENGISPIGAQYRWAVNYYKQNGRQTTKTFGRDPENDQFPENLVDWIRQMREDGYEKALNPRQTTYSTHYRFEWRENGERKSETFEFTEQGLEDAKRFRDEVYPTIGNTNGMEVPNAN